MRPRGGSESGQIPRNRLHDSPTAIHPAAALRPFGSGAEERTGADPIGECVLKSFDPENCRRDASRSATAGARLGPTELILRTLGHHAFESTSSRRHTPHGAQRLTDPALAARRTSRASAASLANGSRRERVCRPSHPRLSALARARAIG